MTRQQTKDRILDAAEKLYAEYGFAETSTRAITHAAGVNLAAVNYHFGSKEGLFRDLVARRFDPINAERIARLDALEALGEPSLEQVLEALVAPILALRLNDPRGAGLLVQITGRLTSPKQTHTDELGEIFRKTSERFMAALRRCIPELGEREQLWRLNCTIGVMIGTMLDPHGFLQKEADSDELHFEREVLADIIAFLAAGLRAPSRNTSQETRHG